MTFFQSIQLDNMPPNRSLIGVPPLKKKEGIYKDRLYVHLKKKSRFKLWRHWDPLIYINYMTQINPTYEKFTPTTFIFEIGISLFRSKTLDIVPTISPPRMNLENHKLMQAIYLTLVTGSMERLMMCFCMESSSGWLR